MKIEKYKIDYPYDKQILISQLKKNINLYSSQTGDYDSPGIQTPLGLVTKEITFIKEIATKKAIDYLKKNGIIDTVIDYCLETWVFISRNETKQSLWHDHLKMGGKYKNSIITDLTFTYYVQMPNNLNGNEGMFSYSFDKNEFSVLPEEDELFLFSSKILHKPEISPNSTKDRIVIAGNFKFNVSNVKEKNTLL
jgi:hypothetical protein